jgi:hypothetical protein
MTGFSFFENIFEPGINLRKGVRYAALPTRRGHTIQQRQARTAILYALPASSGRS